MLITVEIVPGENFRIFRLTKEYSIPSDKPVRQNPNVSCDKLQTKLLVIVEQKNTLLCGYID